jgi:hypothetical protein
MPIEPIPLPNQPIWARQPAETDEGFLALEAFLKLGRYRTLDQLAAKVRRRPVKGSGKVAASGYYFDLSRANRWVERSRAWDIHQADIRREEQEHQAQLDERDNAEKERARRINAWKGHEAVRVAIMALLCPPRAKKGEPRPPRLSAGQLKDAALALDRIRGLASDALAGKSDGTADALAGMSPELADRVRALIRGETLGQSTPAPDPDEDD